MATGFTATGFSAPASVSDVSNVNVSTSSGSVTVKLADTKRSKLTLDELTASVSAAPAAVAVAVDPSRMFEEETRRAQRTTISSGSSLLSVASSDERRRHLDLVRAKRKAADAAALAAECWLEEVQAENDLAASSEAGSVGRRLNDVQSETESFRHSPSCLLYTSDAADE